MFDFVCQGIALYRLSGGIKIADITEYSTGLNVGGLIHGELLGSSRRVGGLAILGYPLIANK